MIQDQLDTLTTSKPGATSKSDMLQVWADIDAHLQFADQIIRKVDFTDAVRTELFDRINHIRLRREDRNLYLAVVGEFNTGKSTFINALLREELLKTSVDVTTTTSTRLCYGPNRDLEVRFRQSKQTLSYLKSREQLRQRIQAASPAALRHEGDTRAYIHAVTADNAVASLVESATIRHPASFLTNDIVVIDTPGINSEHASHAQVANHVVEREADAAIVIIPAPVPLSSTMTAFLTERLRPYIHRCLFVVTQMDKIRESERQKLLENIRVRLLKALGTEQPVSLFAAAPQVVLEMQHDGHNVAPELRHWESAFSDLESSIWDRLRQERALSITESLLRLLTKLFEELDRRLRERWSGYETRQTAIQRETIQDITAFTSEQRRVYQGAVASALADARSKIEQHLTQHSSKAEERIRAAIFGASSAADLKTIVEGTAKTQLEEEGKEFQATLQKRLKDLEQAARRASQAFDQRFAQVYQRLEALAGTVGSTRGQIIDQDFHMDPSTIFYSANRVNDELDSAASKLGWGGAAVGAAIGTALFPGVGTVVGLLAGPILVGLFGPSLYERQTKMWEAVQPALTSSFEGMRTQAFETLNRYEKEVQAAFSQRLNTYMGRYKAIVDQMRQQQQRELAQLKQLQLVIQADQKEIERRRESLVQKQQQLAKRSK